MGFFLLVGALTLASLGATGIVPAAIGTFIGISASTVGAAFIAHFCYNNFPKIKAVFSGIASLLPRKAIGHIAKLMQKRISRKSKKRDEASIIDALPEENTSPEPEAKKDSAQTKRSKRIPTFKRKRQIDEETAKVAPVTGNFLESINAEKSQGSYFVKQLVSPRTKPGAKCKTSARAL